MPNKFLKRSLIVTVVLLVPLVGFYGTTLVMRMKTSKKQSDIPTEVVSVSTTTPEEKLPEDVGYVWRGQENDPKSITISKIGVKALLQNVGVDQNTEIAVPNNIHIAGWFVNSVRPGDKGLSIIDGHVNGPTVNTGVFSKLSELAEGDEVQIESGDGTVSTFTVYSSQDVAVAESAGVLYSQVPSIERQVNLVTCIGDYDKTTQSYDKRHIVVLSRK